MIPRVVAGRSGSLTAEGDFRSAACRVSPVGADEKSSLNWRFQPLVAFEIYVLLASPLVRAFSHRSGSAYPLPPPFGIGVPH